MLKSFFSAFLMYSKIPVPRVEWREENRRYSMCFFPLIGAIIGGFFLLWRYVCDKLEADSFFFGAGAMVIPIVITGGIHLDGFCDVSDARASWGNREKKLEIMRDSHIGAFAAIGVTVYLIVQTALFSQLREFRIAAAAAVGFVLSRTLSGLTAVTFRSARSEGSLQSFVRPAHKKVTIIVLILMTLTACTVMILLSPLAGGAAVFSAMLTVIYYRIFAYREFDGITGDLSGWFLQICEIIIPAAIVLADKTEGILL